MTIMLRKLESIDAAALVALADNRNLSDDMVTLPVPFTYDDARDLIRRSSGDVEVVMGIFQIASGELCGVIMLRDFEMDHLQAELSIWIGEAFWGKGLATQAIIQLSKKGFEEKGLNRIYAYCMMRNVASQRILEKAGFTREGLLRERVIKNGIHEDVYIYARLKKDM